MVLAHLEPAQTAAVLREIGPGVGSAVVYRLARLEKISPEMLELIGRRWAPETDLNLSQGMQQPRRAAGGGAGAQPRHPSLEKELLDALGAEDPELCDEIKNLMFVFEDIILLDDRSVQRVLRDVDSKELALALKAASEELKDQDHGRDVASAPSRRCRRRWSSSGRSACATSRRRRSPSSARVRALEEAGEIVISGGGDEVIQ